jgi:hypothetical protein
MMAGGEKQRKKSLKSDSLQMRINPGGNNLVCRKEQLEYYTMK